MSWTLPRMPAGSRRTRRGFSLLEVMVALAILVVSLAILVETQGTSAIITREAEAIILASDLAQAKMNEALLVIEEEGFQRNDVSENGDFDDFGDEANAFDFKDELEDYHWEYTITEVDLALAGDIAGMAGELAGSGAFGNDIGGEGGAAAAAAANNPLASVGLSSEVITEQLAPYIRMVRVRVWWGKSSDEAEERGDEFIVVTHVVNPSGVVMMGEGGGGTP